MTNGGQSHHTQKTKKAAAKRTRAKPNGLEATVQRLKRKNLLGDRVGSK